MTRAQLIATARKVAARGGQRLTRKTFKAAGLTDYHIVRHFGSWTKLAKAAGIEPNWKQLPRSDAEIFEAMRQGFIAQGGVTTRTALHRHCRYPKSLLNRHFRGWHGSLVAFRAWLLETNAAFPHFEDLAKAIARAASGIRHIARHEVKKQSLLGPSTHFHGFEHAPMNEQGVVLLFGMMARELGFVIESVRIGFPDCEAKRRTATGEWLRTRIEFEYQSRTFLRHRHDPSGCDLIVCWDHNWPTCPLEVLELRTEIKRLSATAA